MSCSNAPELPAYVLISEKQTRNPEIGEVMGVSESRVCQLHTQAIARLRSQMKIQ